MATYRISAKAKDDLRSIWYYSVENWSERQADKYVREMMDEFALIMSNPERGRYYGEISGNFYGIKKNKHIIFYRIVKTGEVEIIRVLHELMDIPNRLQE